MHPSASPGAGLPADRAPAGGGGAAWLRSRSLAVAGAFVLLIACDRAFIPVAVLTPHGAEEPLSPLYALWRPVLSAWHLPAVGFAVILAVMAGRVSRLGPRVAAAGGVVALAGFAAALAMVRGGPAALIASLRVYGSESYLADVPLVFAGLGDFLRSFVERMPELSLHGRTHPPGFTLFLAGAVHAFGPVPLAYPLLIIVCAALAVVPLADLARRRYGAEVGTLAVLLYVTVPSVLLFTATALDALVPLPALAALAAAERARGGHPAWAFAGGLLLACTLFMTFTGLALVIVAAGLVLSGTRRAVPLRLALLTAGIVLPFLLLSAVTGFDIIACFMRARENLVLLETGMKGRGLHPLRDLVYVAAGNLGALAIGLGAPVVVLASRALLKGGRRGPAPSADGLLLGLVVALSAMILSGAYLLEVERVWLLLMGPLVAVAAAELARLHPLADSARSAVSIAIGQALVMETLLYTFW